MKNTSPEEMQAQGKKLEADMLAWMDKHAASIVDKGLPLGKTKRLTAQGAEDTRNDLNYYQVVEAESHEAAVQIFADNPHTVIPTAYIDVMEIPHQGL